MALFHGSYVNYYWSVVKPLRDISWHHLGPGDAVNIQNDGINTNDAG